MILIQEKIVATLLQTHDKKLTATNLNGSTVVVEFFVVRPVFQPLFLPAIVVDLESD